MRLSVTFLAMMCVAANWTSVFGEEPQLKLGQRGKLLLEEKFESVAGDLLAELGYEVVTRS